MSAHPVRRDNSRVFADRRHRAAGRRPPRWEHNMSEHTAQPQFGTPPTATRVRDRAREMTGHWWLGLAAGIAWLVVSLVILQFDDASVTTVGVLVGVMFLLAGAENVALATAPVRGRWAWAVFAGLFFIAAVVCFAEP